MNKVNNHTDNQQERTNLNSAIVDEIIEDLKIVLVLQLDEKNVDKFTNVAMKIGEYFAVKQNVRDHERLTTSKIRKIYNYVRNMKKEEKPHKWEILKALLAYNAGRFKAFKDFQRIFTTAIDIVKQHGNYEIFTDFFEAVIAYHRFYGGKE